MMCLLSDRTRNIEVFIFINSDALLKHTVIHIERFTDHVHYVCCGSLSFLPFHLTQFALFLSQLEIIFGNKSGARLEKWCEVSLQLRNMNPHLFQLFNQTFIAFRCSSYSFELRCAFFSLIRELIILFLAKVYLLVQLGQLFLVRLRELILVD